MSTRTKSGPTKTEDRSKRLYANRNKRANKPEFNAMAKARRSKEKFNAVNRKKNRKCGYGG